MASFKDLLSHALPEGRKKGSESGTEIRPNVPKRGQDLRSIRRSQAHAFITFYFSDPSNGLRFIKTVTGMQKGQNQ